MLSSVVVTANTAPLAGGVGIYTSGAVVDGCMFLANKGSNGSALLLGGDDANVSNTSVVGNTGV